MTNDNPSAGQPAERVEAAQNREIPKASTEAVDGFNNFESTRAAMTPKGDAGLHPMSIEGLDNQTPNNKPGDATVQNAMVSPNGLGRTEDPPVERSAKPNKPGAEQQEGDSAQSSAEAEETEQEDNDPTEIKPGNSDKLNTPVIHPDDVMRPKFDGTLEKPRDESGKIQRDGDINFLADVNESAKSEVGKDGQPTSVVSQSGNETTTFGLNQDGSSSRTIAGPNGTEVVQFDKDGAPTSRRTSENGEQLQDAEVNSDDKLAVTKNDDGTTKIVSTTGDNDTTINLGKDGKPVSRSIETDTSTTATEFNSDGSPKVNTVTNYDGNNKSVETTSQGGRTTESFENDQLVSTKDEGQEFITTNSVLNDGSTVAAVENRAGSSKIVINGADGSKITHSSDPGVTETTIENPDGSSTYAYEDNMTVRSRNIDRDGNWETNQYNKQSGVANRITGDKYDKNGTKVTNMPI